MPLTPATREYRDEIIREIRSGRNVEEVFHEIIDSVDEEVAALDAT